MNSVCVVYFITIVIILAWSMLNVRKNIHCIGQLPRSFLQASHN